MLFACCNECSTIKQPVIFTYIFIASKNNIYTVRLFWVSGLHWRQRKYFLFSSWTQCQNLPAFSLCLYSVIHSTQASTWPPHHLIHLLRCAELQGALHGYVDSSNKKRKKEPSLLPKQGWDVKGHPALLPKAHYVIPSVSFFRSFSIPLAFL